MKHLISGLRLALCAGLLIPAGTSVLLGQEGEPRGRGGGSVYEEALGQFYESLDRKRVKVPFEKMHRSALIEFAPVVEMARQSTVKVYKGEHVRGLGTVVAREGLIVTKASLIEDDEELAVEAPGRDKVVAELIEVNEDDDLALLWVHDFDLTPVQWAPGTDVPIGSLVAAAGSLSIPLAIGTVSLPLRNLSEADKGFLGVQMKARDDGSGLNVVDVVPGSGAESGGIEPGDVIQAIDGQPMETEHDLINTISEAEAGDIVVVQLLREKEKVMLEITLGDKQSGLSFRMPMHEMLDNTARMGGRVSRKRSGYQAAIQHDLLLKPNHCGGPLVNLDGEVIGVNIARASRVKSYAIPSDVIQEWLGDPQELAQSVLRTRVKNAEAARRAAEEALATALEIEEDVKKVLEELESHRAEAAEVEVEVVPASLIGGAEDEPSTEVPESE